MPKCKDDPRDDVEYMVDVISEVVFWHDEMAMGAVAVKSKGLKAQNVKAEFRKAMDAARELVEELRECE